MIQFNQVILHNFGSYNHAEIDLQNKGFCLVTGENHHKKDNALSNGSGKSFIWDAIIWCLTGETGRGISNGLKNINIDQSEEMYVELDFIADGVHYIIRRGDRD